MSAQSILSWITLLARWDLESLGKCSVSLSLVRFLPPEHVRQLGVLLRFPFLLFDREVMPDGACLMAVEDGPGRLPGEANDGREAVDWVTAVLQPLLALGIAWVATAPLSVESGRRFLLSLGPIQAQCLLLGGPRFLLLEVPSMEYLVSSHFGTDACRRYYGVDVVSLRAADDLSLGFVDVLPDVLQQHALVGLLWADSVTDDPLHFEALLQDSHQHREGELV